MRRLLALIILGLVSSLSAAANISDGASLAADRLDTPEIRGSTSRHGILLEKDGARSATTRFLNRKYDEAWYTRRRESGHIDCDRRLAMYVRRCRFSFVSRRSAYRGTLRVALSEGRPSYRQYVRIRYRVSRIKVPCLSKNKPRRACIETAHGRTRFRF
jgi:hypothetical protein